MKAWQTEGTLKAFCKIDHIKHLKQPFLLRCQSPMNFQAGRRSTAFVPSCDMSGVLRVISHKIDGIICIINYY